MGIRPVPPRFALNPVKDGAGGAKGAKVLAIRGPGEIPATFDSKGKYSYQLGVLPRLIGEETAEDLDRHTPGVTRCCAVYPLGYGFFWP
jgi:hypothetical protein